MADPVAIVTGGGRGIGRATAIELGRQGYRLCVVSRTEAELAETCRAAGQAIAVAADVTDPPAAQRIIETALDCFGRIDALVNCAGLAPQRSIEQTTPEIWREVIDSNLSSVFYLSSAVWPIFRRQKGGVIVNLSSFSSRDPFTGFHAYGAAKAGVNLLGLSMHREGAADNIRVHTIAPAAVETAMFRQLMDESQFPRDKTLDPTDVAHVIVQCITGELRHTSGEVIYLHKTA